MVEENSIGKRVRELEVHRATCTARWESTRCIEHTKELRTIFGKLDRLEVATAVNKVKVGMLVFGASALASAAIGVLVWLLERNNNGG